MTGEGLIKLSSDTTGLELGEQMEYGASTSSDFVLKYKTIRGHCH